MTTRLCVEAVVGMSLLLGSSGAVLTGPDAHPTHASAPRPAIAFVSTRDDPSADPALDPSRVWRAAEIYLMDDAGTSVQRLTQNTDADGFPALSPDGTRIVFDSTRRRAADEPFNTSDLYMMKSDGTDQRFLVRGSSATWSPDGRRIAFHASASGAGRPIKSDPGAATTDSDIFVLEVGEGLPTPSTPRNLTSNPAAVDDDPSWSPDGRTILFTSHAVTDDPINSATAEIYRANADGTGKPVRLTNNSEEERAPSWSPDGTRIVFACRSGGPDFEICVLNADGTGQRALTANSVADLTPTWSPDGQHIVFHRPVGGAARFQLFMIKADGTGEKQLTFPPGFNAFPNWGLVGGR